MSKNELSEVIEYYMNLKYRIEITKDEDEGGYIISYPELVGCISSGASIEETIKHGEEARKEWIIAAFESGVIIPEPVSPMEVMLSEGREQL